MTAESTNRGEYHLTLTDEERAQLVGLLEAALAESRVEARRTHTPAFREQVIDEEEVIRGLLDKLRKLQP
jgi:hypothetical protein